VGRLLGRELLAEGAVLKCEFDGERAVFCAAVFGGDDVVAVLVDEVEGAKRAGGFLDGFELTCDAAVGGFEVGGWLDGIHGIYGS